MGPMLRWFVFTIGMGLLPYGFSVLQQILRGIPRAKWQNSPELFFFSIVVCASQLDGILASLSTRPAKREPKAERTLLGTMFGLFLFTAIVAAAMYGVYVDQARNDPARVIGGACAAAGVRPGMIASVSPEVREHCREWLSFQGNLFTFSLWMAGAVGVLGTITEWMRTRREP
jgi:hypothetical protein